MWLGHLLVFLWLALRLNAQSTFAACRNDATREDCGYFGIKENECLNQDCCWNPVDSKPWCFKKTYSPISACQVEKRHDCGYVGITDKECEAKGCCWVPSDIGGQPWCYYKNAQPSSKCRGDGPRFDCGAVGTTEHQCKEKGCCWQPIDDGPWCFHQMPVYTVQEISTTSVGVTMTLVIDNTGYNLPYGDNISPLKFVLEKEDNTRLHVKIYDPNNQRWEVPESILATPPTPDTAPEDPLYFVELPKIGEEFNFAVKRSSDKSTIFNTASYGILQFAEQYITIGTGLTTGYNIYGLGERKDHLKLRKDNPNCGNALPLFSCDRPTIPEANNLYGVHPFYLEMKTTGNAHGVFLKNSNGMDVVLGKNALQYKITGGILDFYFFLGPQPESVISQYLDLIGRPVMPPYWALGFHQCRYGYRHLNELKDVIKGYEENQIPLDTIWSDIDHMDRYKDFTLDPVRFSAGDVQEFIKDLHSKGKHYVVILDPGIAIDPGYPAYDHGIEQDIFIKDGRGNNLEGSVWPGPVYFPDFFHPKIESYWQGEISDFMNNLANVDGIWIDMNECANFCDGFCSKDHATGAQQDTTSSKSSRPFDPRNPPYHINNRCSKQPLSTRTLPVEATQYGGILQYNAHSLYGASQSIVTYNALQAIRPGKRPFVLTRSNFPGTGAYASHWNGDNSATETDLYYSIPMMLSFQLYGIPMVGSDICGFFEDTTEELCGRWMQLGAFYPFARNHNFNTPISQEPYLWDSVTRISKTALNIRYSLLPYYYTLLYKAYRPSNLSSQPSATVVRPLFFEFPQDSATYDMDWVFMIGSALLITPVLRVGEAGKSVTVDFPSGVWYDWYTYRVTSTGGDTVIINTPLDYIPIHIRGGYVIPMQDPATTTATSRQNPFSLLVALNDQGKAVGDLYIDDGESIDNSMDSLFIEFTASDSQLSSDVDGILSSTLQPLDRVRILGVNSPTSGVTVNGEEVKFTYSSDTKSLLVGPGLKISMNEAFTMKWA